jgi:hypothetical protein
MSFFGRGVKKSTHCSFLAADLLLDTQLDNSTTWVWQRDSEAYKFLGDYWKTLHPLARWGGDFRPSRDGNHFSFEHQGVR